MEVFDKEQRHEIYTEGLKFLLQEIEDKETKVSTCDILDGVIYDLHYDDDLNLNVSRKILPEWYDQEPKQNSKPVMYHRFTAGKEPQRVDYWWTHSPQGYQARVRALKRCINLTK